MSYRIHRLKTVQPYFNEVLSGEKPWELRKMDRDFQIGDKVLLEEYNSNGYTGQSFAVKIENIHSGLGKFGLEEGRCILTINHFGMEAIVRVKNKDGREGRLERASEISKIMGKHNRWYVSVIWDGNKKSSRTVSWNLEVISVFRQVVEFIDEVVEPKELTTNLK